MSTANIILLVISGLSLYFLLTKKYIDWLFWFIFILYSDPGGLLEGYFQGDLIGRVNFNDVFFVIMFLATISVRSKRHVDMHFKRIFNILLFIIIYIGLIYGLILPLYFDRSDFLMFAYKSREYYIYSLPVMYFVYIFSIRSLDIFFNMMLVISVVIMTLYFMTLILGIDVIPVYTVTRSGSEVGNERLYMPSYGYIVWYLFIGIIYYFAGNKFRKIKKRKYYLLYYITITMSAAIFLTLTRRNILDIIFGFFIIMVYCSYLISKSYAGNMIKLSFFGFAIIIIYSIFFPNNYNDLKIVSGDTFSLLTKGETEKGESDYRVTGTGDLDIAKNIIANNLIFGTGYVPWIWADVVNEKGQGNELAIAWDASAEVPIYGGIMRFGIIGVIIFTVFYWKLVKYIIRIAINLKRNMHKINDKHINYFLVLIFIIYSFISKFTYQLYSLYGEFYGYGLLNLCILLGMFFGVVRKLNGEYSARFIKK